MNDHDALKLVKTKRLASAVLHLFGRGWKVTEYQQAKAIYSKDGERTRYMIVNRNNHYVIRKAI